MTGRTWLIVEDDWALRTMLVMTITVMWDDLKVIALKDGFEASEWISKIEVGARHTVVPELALLDIRMPGPQGHEIAGRLRKVSAAADIKIVIMTAYRFPEEERREIEQIAQPDLFLEKPLPPPNELKALLDDLTRVD